MNQPSSPLGISLCISILIRFNNNKGRRSLKARRALFTVPFTLALKGFITFPKSKHDFLTEINSKMAILNRIGCSVDIDNFHMVCIRPCGGKFYFERLYLLIFIKAKISLRFTSFLCLDHELLLKMYHCRSIYPLQCKQTTSTFHRLD